MTYELNPEKVVRLLTLSTRQLDNATISSLANARQNALNRHSAKATAFTFSPASAHSSVRWTDRLMPHAAHPWIAAGLLVAVLIAGIGAWQNIQEQQIDDTDVAILTDDLPIEVFVD